MCLTVKRAAVSKGCDALDDLRAIERGDLNELFGLASWPQVPRRRFVCAWQKLKSGGPAGATSQPTAMDTDPPAAVSTEGAAAADTPRQPPAAAANAANAPSSPPASADAATTSAASVAAPPARPGQAPAPDAPTTAAQRDDAPTRSSVGAANAPPPPPATIGAAAPAAVAPASRGAPSAGAPAPMAFEWPASAAVDQTAPGAFKDRSFRETVRRCPDGCAHEDHEAPAAGPSGDDRGQEQNQKLRINASGRVATLLEKKQKGWLVVELDENQGEDGAPFEQRSIRSTLVTFLDSAPVECTHCGKTDTADLHRSKYCGGEIVCAFCAERAATGKTPLRDLVRPEKCLWCTTNLGARARD